MELKDQIAEAIAAIARKTRFKPKVGIILGTGLGALAKEIKGETVVEYGDIPHMPTSTVETHHGKMHFGTLGSKAVVAFQGRFHLYEGYSAQEVSFPVRLMKALGCTHMLVSNAAGGIADQHMGATQGLHQAHGKAHLLRAVAFVEMKAALKSHHRLGAEGAKVHFSVVRFNGAGGHVGDVPVFDHGLALDFFG